MSRSVWLSCSLRVARGQFSAADTCIPQPQELLHATLQMNVSAELLLFDTIPFYQQVKALRRYPPFPAQ
jgi:hypothetical protein